MVPSAPSHAALPALPSATVSRSPGAVGWMRAGVCVALAMPLAAQARVDAATVGAAAVPVGGFLLLLLTLFRPWLAQRGRRPSNSWALGAALAALLLGLSVATVLAVMPPATWRLAVVTWNSLTIATVLAAIAVILSDLRRGPHRGLPRLQQSLAIAWLVLVPITSQWDRLTRHHHTVPPTAHDARSDQLRALTGADAGSRLLDTRPPAGQCTLRVSRPGASAPLALAVYGRDTGSPQDRLTIPTAWRERRATLVGLENNQMGLTDNAGLVRRTGSAWQLDIDGLASWAQVEAAHNAARSATARQAERAAREAEWREADTRLRLIATTQPDPHAEVPLRLQSDSAFDRLEAPVVARALTSAGLACSRTTSTSSGWQCVDARAAWSCPVVHLSELCQTPGRGMTGQVLNLQSGVPPAEADSDTSWFLFRSRSIVQPACVLMSRRLADTAARAANGPATLTCDPSPADANHPMPVLSVDLPFPTEADRARLGDAVSTLRKAFDAASRAATPQADGTLPYRIDALTDREVECDDHAGPCRRFDAHLVTDGSAIELRERCSDPATAASHSRFSDPFFKR